MRNMGYCGVMCFMRVLGIDPGYAIVGYGAVDFTNNRFTVINYGAITTKAGLLFSTRLEEIYNDMLLLLDKTTPDAIAIEKLFFNTNTTTAMDVAHARGVILLAAKQKGVPVYEYTPPQVKSAVTGYGLAEKKQVMEMTKNILSLDKIPKPDDTADALAIAICHAHIGGSMLGKLNPGGMI